MREKPAWVRLNGREWEMVEELMDWLGFNSPSELFRYLLRVKWEEALKERAEVKCHEEGGKSY